MENSTGIISNQYWGENQTAEFCGVKVNTLRVWNVKRCGPPRVKVGRKVLYRVDALKSWLDSREEAVISTGMRGK